MMRYKGYLAEVGFDDEAELFHGEVLGLKDVITFQETSVKELVKAFHDSVNDFLLGAKNVASSPKKRSREVYVCE